VRYEKPIFLVAFLWDYDILCLVANWWAGGMVILRANSRRAYQRLFQLWPPAKEKSFYSLTNLWHDKAKGYWQIPDDMLLVKIIELRL
jgi:hypothetical protein